MGNPGRGWEGDRGVEPRLNRMIGQTAKLRHGESYFTRRTLLKTIELLNALQTLATIGMASPAVSWAMEAWKRRKEGLDNQCCSSRGMVFSGRGLPYSLAPRGVHAGPGFLL